MSQQLKQKSDILGQKIKKFKKDHKGYLTLFNEKNGGLTESTREEDINENFITSNSKISIFEHKVLEVSLKYLDLVREMEYNWMGGTTSCANNIFFTRIFPDLDLVQYFIDQEKFKDAFAVMQGLSMYLSYSGESIINDNEVYTEMDQFVKVFDDISNYWKFLMEKNYESLGMYNEQTKINVVDFLKEMETQVNQWLLPYDEFVENEQNGYPRIQIYGNYQPQNE